jgi:hypothetical protein
MVAIGGSGGSSSLGGSSGELDCGAFGSTVAEVEMRFFPMKCGANSTDGGTCHGVKNPFGDFTTLPLGTRLRTKKTTFLCTGAPLIDTTTSAKSILSIAAHETPACPNGMAFEIGNRMPFGRDPLTAAERSCLESYVAAVAAGQ